MKGVQIGMPESVKYAELEEFGFGPNIMKKTCICSSCGRTTDVTDGKCLFCGKGLPEGTLYDYYKQMHVCCSVCDTVLTSDSKYCPHCGTEIHR